jgi:hypothetical protein
VQTKGYSPPPVPSVTRSRSVGVATPKRHPPAKAAQRKRGIGASRPAKRAPVTPSLAPLEELLAVTKTPVPPADENEDKYLWLAGLAFAVLAAAGLSLHLLAARLLEVRVE